MIKPTTRPAFYCWQLGGYAYKARMKAFAAGARACGGSVNDIRHAINAGTLENLAAIKRPLFAFTCGMHRPEQRARLWLKERGIPLFVLDLGYFKRAQGSHDTVGYNQLGVDKLNWVPSQVVDSSRWDALGMPEVSRGAVKNRPKIVLCLGQVPNDSQHKMRADQLNDWLGERAAKWKAYGYRVLYRSHPCVRLTSPLPWVDEMIDGKSETLAQSLDRAGHVITFNSTAGIEAISAGIPLTCADTAHYADVSGYGSGKCTRDDVMRHLHRLAWSQWTCAELETGEPLRFVAKCAGVTI